MVWIFSVSRDGMCVSGFSGMPTYQPYQFQKEMREALQPEIEVNFISYDTGSHAVPVADLIVYDEKDGVLIDEELKRKAVGIPAQDIFSRNIEKIRNEIEMQLKKSK